MKTMDVLGLAVIGGAILYLFSKNTSQKSQTPEVSTENKAYSSSPAYAGYEDVVALSKQLDELKKATGMSNVDIFNAAASGKIAVGDVIAPPKGSTPTIHTTGSSKIATTKAVVQSSGNTETAVYKINAAKGIIGVPNAAGGYSYKI